MPAILPPIKDGQNVAFLLRNLGVHLIRRIDQETNRATAELDQLDETLESSD